MLIRPSSSGEEDDGLINIAGLSPGEITVSGHTDDFQVSNELYINNWDLSSKRAVAVASELQKVAGFDKAEDNTVGQYQMVCTE